MKFRKDGKEWKDMSREERIKIIKYASIGIVAVVLIVSYHLSGLGIEEISISEFKDQIRQGKLEKVEIKPRLVFGAYKQEEVADTLVSGEEIWDIKAKYIGEAAPGDIKALLDEYSVFYTEDPPSTMEQFFERAFPFLILIAIYFLFIRKAMFGGAGGTKGLLSFQKSLHKVVDKEKRIKTRFTDVAGIDEAVQEVQEVVEFLQNPDKLARLGGKVPQGVLLLGPSGCGKTLLARAVAGESGVPFFSLSGADFVQVFVGVGASRVRDLFKEAKKAAPAIIFIDELDAMGRQRGAGLGISHDEREQTLNAILVEMDGFEEQEIPVIVMAATNRPDILDTALQRSGRFDRRIYIPYPDMKGRKKIFEIHAKDKILSENIDAGKVAQMTPQMTGADIKTMINEAALLAARQEKDAVEMEDIEESIFKIYLGAERSLDRIEKEREFTAYHEAGHALITEEFSGILDPLIKVTIIPRGRALGVTLRLPEKDRYKDQLDELTAALVVYCGGRAAEEVVFGPERISSGAGGDINDASKIVRKMVCEWGMSSSLGFLRYGKRKEEPFLARDAFQGRDYSEWTAYKIDKETKKIMDQALNNARSTLRKRRAELDAIAQALLEKDTLDGDEVRQIIKNANKK